MRFLSAFLCFIAVTACSHRPRHPRPSIATSSWGRVRRRQSAKRTSRCASMGSRAIRGVRETRSASRAAMPRGHHRSDGSGARSAVCPAHRRHEACGARGPDDRAGGTVAVPVLFEADTTRRLPGYASRHTLNQPTGLGTFAGAIATRRYSGRAKNARHGWGGDHPWRASEPAGGGGAGSSSMLIDCSCLRAVRSDAAAAPSADCSTARSVSAPSSCPASSRESPGSCLPECRRRRSL